MQIMQSIGECYNLECSAGMVPLLSCFELQDGFPKMEMVVLNICKWSGLWKHGGCHTARLSKVNFKSEMGL